MIIKFHVGIVLNIQKEQKKIIPKDSLNMFSR